MITEENILMKVIGNQILVIIFEQKKELNTEI